MEDKISWIPFDVDRLLREKGLDRDGLVRAVHFAESERAFCTENDPIGFGSYVVYAKAARSLRETYLSKGWVKDDSSNQAAIKNPKTMVRIVPCNFDEYAGNRLVRPSNKSPKGEVSRKKSLCNRTAWLPGVPDIEPELNDGYETWLLGMFIEDVSPIGAELSFPVAFDGNYFTAFGHRIILLSGDDDEAKGSRKRPDDDDHVDVVDISVTRK